MVNPNTDTPIDIYQETALNETFTSKGSLLDLPIELQHEIFLFLHPLDVLSLGSTCRSLLQSTSDRILWARLKRQADLVNRTFLFQDYDNKSLRELKHAATSPARMLRRLQNSQNEDAPILDSDSGIWYGGLAPVRTTMFRPKVRPRIRKDTSCLFLIPGGRLLVLSIGHRLSIWDLEASPPCKLANKNCAPGFIFLITPSKDQQSFSIAVSINNNEDDDDDEPVMLQIHTFSSSTPNVLHTAQTQLEVQQDYDIAVFTLVHNLFVYLHEENIHVWDHIRNTFSSWNVPKVFGLQAFPEIFVYEERQIVIIGERFILGYNIPPLVSETEYGWKAGATLLGTVEPVFSIDLSHTFNEKSMHVDTPGVWRIRPGFVEKAHDWYTVFSPPKLFDIVWTTGPGENDYFTTIGLEELFDNPQTPFEIKLGSTIRLPSLADMLSDEPDGDRCLDTWRICEDAMIKGQHRREGRMFDVIVGSATDCLAEPFVTRLGSFAAGEDKTYNENFDRFRFSFDPVSGRVCYMSRQHQSVVVIDYLGIDKQPVYDDNELEESIGCISLYDSDSD